MDLLYPLGGGSVWGDNELRFSLRSVEKYLTNFERIFIIGNRPSFLSDEIVEVKYEDQTPYKEYNIFKKVEYASLNAPGLSEDFLFFNDDHFLLQHFDATQFPYYYKCPLEETINRKLGEGKYKRALRNTLNALVARGLPTLNYDGHQPIIYNRRNIVQLGVDYEWVNESYVLKSLYANTYRVQGVVGPDCKLNSQLYDTQILELIKNKPVWSIGNVVLQPTPDDLLKVMMRLYPKQSRWEIA